jgi:hypothetical protein
VAQERSRHFIEERLHDVQPRTRRGWTFHMLTAETSGGGCGPKSSLLRLPGTEGKLRYRGRLITAAEREWMCHNADGSRRATGDLESCVSEPRLLRLSALRVAGSRCDATSGQSLNSDSNGG